MSLLYDGVIAFLAAVGLATVLWVLADLVLRRREKVPDAVFVLPVRGSAAGMEQEVQTLLVLRRQVGQYTPVLLADCGLSEESRRCAAILEERYSGVVVVTPAQIEEYIT